MRGEAAEDAAAPPPRRDDRTGAEGGERGVGLAQVPQLAVAAEVLRGARVERQDVVEHHGRGGPGDEAAGARVRVQVAGVGRVAAAASHVDDLVLAHPPEQQHAHVELGARHLQDLLLRARRDEAAVPKVGVRKVDEGRRVGRRLHAAVVQRDDVRPHRARPGRLLRGEHRLEFRERRAGEALEAHQALVVRGALEREARCKVQEQRRELVSADGLGIERAVAHELREVEPALVSLGVGHGVSNVAHEAGRQHAAALGRRELVDPAQRERLEQRGHVERLHRPALHGSAERLLVWAATHAGQREDVGEGLGAGRGAAALPERQLAKGGNRLEEPLQLVAAAEPPGWETEDGHVERRTCGLSVG